MRLLDMTNSADYWRSTLPKDDLTNPDLVQAFYEGFLEPDLADQCLASMMMEVDWEKRSDAPRMEHWSNDFNRPYTYGRGAGMRTYEARPAPAAVNFVRKLIAKEFGVDYQGCFCNRYDTNRDWLGWHSDDDPGIDHSVGIAVVTLGCSRDIMLAPFDRETGRVKKDLAMTTRLTHGSLFIMGAGVQSRYRHQIPKSSDTRVSTRVSLTFRALLK